MGFLKADVMTHLRFAKDFAWDRNRVSLFFVPFIVFAICLGLIALPFVVLLKNLLTTGKVNSLTASFVGMGIIALIALIILFIVFVLVMLLLGATIIKVAAEFHAGKKPSLRACFNYALSRFMPLLILTILIGVIISLVSLPLTVFSLLGPAGTVIGTIIRFIVNIFFALVFLFSQYFLIVKNFGVIDSLKKSWDLFFKKRIGVIIAFLVCLVASIVLLIAAAVPALVLGLIGGVFFFAAKNVVLLILFVVLAVIAFLVGFAFLEVFNSGLLASFFFDLTEGKVPARSVPVTKTAKRRKKRRRKK